MQETQCLQPGSPRSFPLLSWKTRLMSIGKFLTLKAYSVRLPWLGSMPLVVATVVVGYLFLRTADLTHDMVNDSRYEASAWLSSGLGDHHTHDIQLALFICGYNHDIWRHCLRVDPSEYFDDPDQRLAPDAETLIVLANPVQPHSEGEIVLSSADPTDQPDIRMNYFDDPHDMEVMVAVLRRALDVVAQWPAPRELGPLLLPPALAAKHGYVTVDTPSDDLLEDLARHYSFTVYHLTSTCRMGSVVDERLRVNGVADLRVGNTNAAAIMIGEKAAEMLAADHGVRLRDVVAQPLRP